MMTIERRLEEREKELACIYSICLLAAGAPQPEKSAEGIARALCSAMQFERDATCRISFFRPESSKRVSVCRGAASFESGEHSAFIEASLPSDASLGWEGTIRIEYARPELRFLPQEKALLDSVLVVAASMLRTAGLIADLRALSENLTAKNVALREVLSQIEDERRRTLLGFRERLAGEILPLAERARDASLSAERRTAYADLLVDELSRDVSSMGPGPSAALSLSPREREVAVQVRNGRTSKEIAEVLGVSSATVERHRHNIRKKLRIADRGVNLSGALGDSHFSSENGR